VSGENIETIGSFHMRHSEEPKTSGELLIRIDERTKILIEDMNSLKMNYVRKEEFQPVRNIVYGMMGLIAVAVVGALIRLVVAQ